MRITKTFILLALGVNIFFCGTHAWALSCVTSAGPLNFEKAAFVFTGEVVSPSDEKLLHFKIVKVYKGKTRESVQVTVNVWDQGVYKVGEHLLVYAEYDDSFFFPKLTIPPCGRALRVEDAKTELIELERLLHAK